MQQTGRLLIAVNLTMCVAAHAPALVTEWLISLGKTLPVTPIAGQGLLHPYLECEPAKP